MIDCRCDCRTSEYALHVNPDPNKLIINTLVLPSMIGTISIGIWRKRIGSVYNGIYLAEDRPDIYPYNSEDTAISFMPLEKQSSHSASVSSAKGFQSENKNVKYHRWRRKAQDKMLEINKSLGSALLLFACLSCITLFGLSMIRMPFGLIYLYLVQSVSCFFRLSACRLLFRCILRCLSFAVASASHMWCCGTALIDWCGCIVQAVWWQLEDDSSVVFCSRSEEIDIVLMTIDSNRTKRFSRSTWNTNFV